MSRLAACLVALCAAIFIACGGGGGGKPAAQAPTAPEGKDRPAGPQEDAKTDAEAEVRRLFEERLRKSKEQHAAAVAKYEVDLKRFNQAMEDYERAIAEHPGKLKEYEAKKLIYESENALLVARRAGDNLRKVIADAKAAGKSAEVERLTDRLDERYAEVIRKYPGTQAEADARALRKGESPPPRPLPPNPVAPAKPVAPVQPRPPAPPPSPEQLLAEAKKEYEDAVAKAAEEKRKWEVLKPHDDRSHFISRFGPPDEEISSEDEKPRPLIVTRQLIYKKENLRAAYRADAKIGSPPPYKNWKLMGFQNHTTDQPIPADEVVKLMAHRDRQKK